MNLFYGPEHLIVSRIMSLLLPLIKKTCEKNDFCENNRLVLDGSTNTHRMEAVVRKCFVKKVFFIISQN